MLFYGTPVLRAPSRLISCSAWDAAFCKAFALLRLLPATAGKEVKMLAYSTIGNSRMTMKHQEQRLDDVPRIGPTGDNAHSRICGAPDAQREFWLVLAALTALYIIAVAIGNRRYVWFDELLHV